MPLNDQTQLILNQIKTLGLPPLNELEPIQAREQAAQADQFSHKPEPVARVENRLIPGSTVDIPIRIYTPAGNPPFPILVFFHGGGWVIGSLDAVDSICRTLANQAGCIVVSVDYRLAPEHKFPAAVEDAYTAIEWVAKNAASFQGDPKRIAVGGDSAGGNLAAVVALLSRDRNFPSLSYQVLFYPATQYGFDTDSHRQNGKDYLLTTELLVWFWHHYLSSAADGQNPQASPLLAGDLSNLPPALIITPEYDPLRDEGEAYGMRLQKAGVSVRMTRYDGTIHGFVGMAHVLDQGREALAEAAVALQSQFT
ncbi:alpha/beta hydrolase fold domain protein [Coleofasciculus chthonoplastes PCC 7420]|uniref:Alpha/beta hydrolase fold domain protein n=1 Tax=Coleofasciculus chthonoplastes PCC 7420 TaxID=118168 RepID=B4VRW3_9CYAN|nr:alpha/beta hydrolase [Coleofasciculus chthonoplastes]EDX75541.1 alpha/beta hydrolase fold domain protein [Coleofasciculus chthonoplastes PCC 7420]